MRCMSALCTPVKGGWRETGKAGHSTLFPRAMLYIDTRYTLRSLSTYEYRLPGALDARGTSGGRCDCEFEFRRVKEADRENRRLP